MVQVSIDGPNVNVKCATVLPKQQKENSLCQLIDARTCNFHISHGAFQAGAIIANWGLKFILKDTFYLHHYSPARCDDFTSVTG